VRPIAQFSCIERDLPALCSTALIFRARTTVSVDATQAAQPLPDACSRLSLVRAKSMRDYRLPKRNVRRKNIAANPISAIFLLCIILAG
jgi:hypothetical protein